MRKLIFFIGTVLVLTGLCSCAGTKKVPNMEMLGDSEWNLEMYLQNQELVSLKANTKASLTIKGNRAHVYTGINNMNLECKIGKDNSIVFEEGPITLMSGGPEETAVEHGIIFGLFTTKSYSLERHTLKFYDANGIEVLRFVNAAFYSTAEK